MDKRIIADEDTIALCRGLSAGYTEERLIAASNKGIYKRAVKELDACGDIQLTAGGTAVRVKLPDAEAVMESDISRCSCSCPSKTVCRHIISAAVLISSVTPAESAVMQASEEKNESVSEKPTDSKKASAKEDSADKEYLAEVLDTALKMLIKGIMNCTEDDIEIMSRLSLAAPTVHRDISRMCRSMSDDIRQMLDRTTGFAPLTAALRLGRLYNTAEVSMSDYGKPLLFTGNEYSPVGRVDLMCMGVYPHRSKSGFAGITAVMFEEYRKRYYTYNVTLSEIYSKTENAASAESFTKMIKSRSHWQTRTAVEMFMGRRLSLYGCKADKNGRISSSGETACSVGETICSLDIPSDALAIPEMGEYDYFLPDRRERFAALKIKVIDDVHFDKGSQMLYYTLVTDKASYRCELEYSKLSQYVIRYIEKNAGREVKDTYFLMRFFGRMMMPVSVIDLGGVHNIYFGA